MLAQFWTPARQRPLDRHRTAYGHLACIYLQTCPCLHASDYQPLSAEELPRHRNVPCPAVVDSARVKLGAVSGGALLGTYVQRMCGAQVCKDLEEAGITSMVSL